MLCRYSVDIGQLIVCARSVDIILVERLNFPSSFVINFICCNKIYMLSYLFIVYFFLGLPRVCCST